ncbi:MAG: hypothetical protein AAF488_17115, partial [Planctomycetota bacterium]
VLGAEKPSTNIRDYAPIAKGMEFVYDVKVCAGTEIEKSEIRYLVLGKMPNRRADSYEVQVISEDRVDGERLINDRRVVWTVDDASNSVIHEYLLLDRETGEMSRRQFEERLKLPRAFSRDEIFGRSGTRPMKVHRQLTRVRGFEGCLLVETVHSDQRTYRYYKKGVGLVALEVFQIDDPHPGTVRGGVGSRGAKDRPLFAVDRQNPGKLVYARYLRLPPPANS